MFPRFSAMKRYYFDNYNKIRTRWRTGEECVLLREFPEEGGEMPELADQKWYPPDRGKMKADTDGQGWGSGRLGWSLVSLYQELCTEPDSRGGTQTASPSTSSWFGT